MDRPSHLVEIAFSFLSQSKHYSIRQPPNISQFTRSVSLLHTDPRAKSVRQFSLPTLPNPPRLCGVGRTASTLPGLSTFGPIIGFNGDSTRYANTKAMQVARFDNVASR